jgi:hypothetical protein
MKTDDLKTFSLTPTGDGSVSAHAAALELCRYYNEVIKWYMHEKTVKSRYSKSLRLVSLVLAVVGGAIPLAANAIGGINQAYGYLFLAVAGGFQLIDRFFGYSSAWNRYMATAINLSSRLMLFQFELAESEALKVEEKKEWELVLRYARELTAAIGTETTQWGDEFKEIVKISAAQSTKETIKSN